MLGLINFYLAGHRHKVHREQFYFQQSKKYQVFIIMYMSI
jgi:hypothetical protein